MVAAGLVLFAACSSGDSPGGSNDLPQYIVDELKNASDFEREILKDGVVTADEYEKAVMETLRCLDEHGVAHSAPAMVGEGGLMAPKLKYTVGPWPEEEDARYSKLYHDCFDEYERGPLTGWTLQSEPSQSALAKANERLVECLQEQGVQFSNYQAFEAAEGSLTGSDADIAAKCRLLILRGVNLFE